MSSVSPIAAFVAGLVSFLSPCVLPLVPGYVSLISGVGVEELRAGGKGLMPKVMRSSLMFILGFSIVFIALGAVATEVGQLMMRYKALLAEIAGVVIILFGLHLTGILKIRALLADKRLHQVQGGSSPWGAFAIGFAFAFGWTPCVGPFLGSILTLAAGSASLREGVVLLLVYSFGLGVPFLITGLLIDHATPAFRRISPFLPIINLISGVALVITGLLVLSGTLVTLARYAPFLGG